MITKFDTYNESLRDKMTTKSEDEILSVLNKLNVDKRLDYIKKYKLDKKYYPSDNDILNYMKNLSLSDRILFATDLKFPEKFYPSDNEVKNLIKEKKSLNDILQLMTHFIVSGQLKYVKMLVDDCIDYISKKGKLQLFMEFWLHKAMKQVRPDIFEYFLELGVDINSLPDHKVEVNLSPKSERRTKLRKIYQKYKNLNESQVNLKKIF